MEEILEDLENHPVLGLKRKLQFKGLDYLRVDTKEMQLIFLERFTNEAGELITDSSINNREIRYYVTNSNTVNVNGIVITIDRVKAIVNQKAGESDEDYEARIQTIYDNQIKQGTPQFNYYIQKFFIPAGIKDIITILKTENKIDNK